MTIWKLTDDGHADLTSHDTFVHGAPHNTFSRLRKDDPLHWTHYDGGEDFWSVTRHADILEMNRNFEVFSSARGIRMEDQTYEEYLARRTFQETDGAEHRAMRMKVQKAFSAPVIAEFEQDIRELCIDILDDALSTDTFDATKKYRANFPCACWAGFLVCRKRICPGWWKREML